MWQSCKSSLVRYDGIPCVIQINVRATSCRRTLANPDPIRVTWRYDLTIPTRILNGHEWCKPIVNSHIEGKHPRQQYVVPLPVTRQWSQPVAKNEKWKSQAPVAGKTILAPRQILQRIGDHATIFKSRGNIVAQDVVRSS